MPINFYAGMKEDDICELLKFERKQLRARITILKTDKFLQGRLKMETGPDGKAAKVTYYFINYKTFVNVVKYKLDWMRKRMETTERDATSRSSFKCVNCSKTFTDLEVIDIQMCSIRAIESTKNNQNVWTIRFVRICVYRNCDYRFIDNSRRHVSRPPIDRRKRTNSYSFDGHEQIELTIHFG